MNSCFNVHNIKISLKLKSPSHSYLNEVIFKNKEIKQKNFGNFRIVYCNFTYIWVGWFWSVWVTWAGNNNGGKSGKNDDLKIHKI